MSNKNGQKPKKQPTGILFPLDNKNARSSTQPAKEILAAAVGSVNSDKAKAILDEKKWRFGYVKHFNALVEEQCINPENSIKIAKAGLDKAHEIFEFIEPNSQSLSTSSLKEAMSAKSSTKFFTGFIQGLSSDSKTEIEVPYNDRILKGEELKTQVKKWVSVGTIEQSAGDAICECIEHPEWVSKKTLSQRYFCLLGAGSAMGPFEILMSLGANVIAIDLDRPHIWKRLATRARNSSGSLTFPTKIDPKTCKDDEALFAASGCNLFTDTPIIRDWLLELYPGKPICVGSYAYLDGARHVQVSLAMDAICGELSEKRPDTSLAYLCTPTDVHLITKEAWEAANKNYEDYSNRLFCKIMRGFGKGKFLVKNIMEPVKGEGGDYYLVNGLVVAQGPNYALAKRMQHWRAITARAKGCIVSSNIAPSTSTVSVVHNRQFAWAYEGMPYFVPFEIMTPEVSNSVMTALLMHDLNSSKSAANPKVQLKNPNELFKFGSFHGGVWRCAYTVGSIGESSVVIYFMRIGKPYIIMLLIVIVAIITRLIL